jgi:A/G-specific adenine glycosylase
MADLAKRLLDWHHTNKRSFPWKQTTDPYLIWVSEIILQQTRIQQGLPYYLAFAKSFPNVQSLANAREDEVLRIWKGLGYYSRARNMHETARYICDHLKGEFPKNYDELIKLKGIGPYSAAAIASFAFGEKKPVIDGNVIRAITRIFGIDGIISKVSTKKRIQKYADELIADVDPAEFNQAIMDFGSKMCKPQNPLCSVCFAQQKCVAFMSDNIDKYPVKEKKKTLKSRYFHYFVCSVGEKVIIKKRKENDIWLGLYEFPMIESQDYRRKTNASIKSFLKDELAVDSAVRTNFHNEYKQVLSHQIVHGFFYEINFKALKYNNPAYMLVDKKNLSNFAVPKIVDRYLTD